MTAVEDKLDRIIAILECNFETPETMKIKKEIMRAALDAQWKYADKMVIPQ